MEENIKGFIVDASFVLNYILPDEKNLFVDKTFNQYIKREINLSSSLLLPFEVLNALKTAIIRKRLDKNTASKLTKAFLNLEINLEKINFYKSFLLAQDKNLTVYDASYLILSFEKKLKLLTTDKKLKALSN